MCLVARVLFIATCVVATTSRAPAWTLPDVDGELRGELTPTLFPGAPVLHWETMARRVKDGTRHVVLTLQGEGTHLRAEADVDIATGAGSWVLTEAMLDGRVWVAPFFNWIGGSAAGIVGGGELRLRGRGALRDGQPVGTLAATWRRGNLRGADGSWTIDGISFEGEFAVDARDGRLHSTDLAKIFVQTIATSRYGARNFAIDARLRDTRSAQVEAARIEIAGGEAVAKPCVVSLRPFEIQVDVAFTRVGLADIVALVPGLLSDARGRVDGHVHLGWTPSGGLQLGEGAIAARSDEPAEFRLAPTPGLITDKVPPTVKQQVPALGLIEMGKVPLRATLLNVVFMPKPDANGRTAYLHLIAGPVDPKLHAPVDLEVNVRGPIQPLIKYGTDPRLHFGSR